MSEEKTQLDIALWLRENRGRFVKHHEQYSFNAGTYQIWTTLDEIALLEAFRAALQPHCSDPAQKALKIYANHSYWDAKTRDRFTFNDSQDLGPTVWGYLLAEAALATMKPQPRFSAREFWDTLPHCAGYPSCDGDLEGENHSSGCPLFGRKELSIIEFAEDYASFIQSKQSKAK